MNRITTMNQNNTGSRSPSRTRQSHNSSGAPGVLAVSATMLANANQSQTGSAKSSGRRSKGQTSGQRSASGKTSRNNNRDSGMSAGEEAVEASSNGPSLGSDSVQRTGAATPSKRSRKSKQPQTQQDDTQSHFSAALASIVKSADARSMPTSEVAAPQSDVDPLPARHLNNSPVGSRRPRHRRGRSQNTLQVRCGDNGGGAVAQEQVDTLIPSHEELAISPTPSMLSKSAPASSFLEAPSASRRTRKQSQKGSYIIANANSADEWDMPRTATGNDALTWQQQEVARKPSGNKQQYAKKPVQEQQHQASSGISAMAAAAASKSSGTPPPSLTWQQQLLRQNSNSSTPTDLFTALEDGHSGAHPGKDSRSRSSPTKPRSGKREQTVSYPGAETEGIDKTFSSMVLAETTSAKRGKKGLNSAKNKQPSTPSPSKPMIIASSGSKSSAQRSTSDSDASIDEIGDLSLDESTTPTVPIQARPISIAASPTKATLYAGPKFHNSPSAGQLPTPRMAAFLSRTREANHSPEVLAA